MEMSSQEQNAQASGTQTETTDPAAPAPAQNATGTGTVDEAAAQKIALDAVSEGSGCNDHQVKA